MSEIGRIRKSETTEIVVQKTEFKGSVGIDIREYVTSDRYTGWSKNGIRISVDKWKEFKAIQGGKCLKEIASSSSATGLAPAHVQGCGSQAGGYTSGETKCRFE
jgi:hypothetical protein